MADCATRTRQSQTRNADRLYRLRDCLVLLLGDYDSWKTSTTKDGVKMQKQTKVAKVRKYVEVRIKNQPDVVYELCRAISGITLTQHDADAVKEHLQGCVHDPYRFPSKNMPTMCPSCGNLACEEDWEEHGKLYTCANCSTSFRPYVIRKWSTYLQDGKYNPNA